MLRNMSEVETARFQAETNFRERWDASFRGNWKLDKWNKTPLKKTERSIFLILNAFECNKGYFHWKIILETYFWLEEVRAW